MANDSTGTQDETNSTSSRTTGSAANDSNGSSGDVSLNELSADHNNDLFASTVAGACADALANQVDGATGHDLETEQIGNTTSPSAFRNKHSEDREHLLSGNGNARGGNAPSGAAYAQAVDADSANLWNKAMTTLSKGKCSKSPSESEEPNENGPAYDMGAILDGSINGGEARQDKAKEIRSNSSSPKKRHNQMIPSSDYSLGGESAIVWTDDVEENYFKYMMDQEKQHRAELGKDQDDSLLGSTRDELLNAMATGHQGAGTSTFDEDDTTLGHGSKIFGWDQTVVGASAAGGSTLTPSLLKGATRDKDGHLIIPNVIYVSDGNSPDPKVKPRFWNAPKKSEAPNNKSKKEQAANKQLDDDDLEGAHEAPKSPCHANRILIGAAVFFLLLTTGLVAALIIYRNHYNNQQSSGTGSESSALGGGADNMPDDDLYDPSALAPSLAPDFTTPYPTLISKKADDDLYGDEDDEEVEELETDSPTAKPTEFPTIAPSATPTSAPTAEPTMTPSIVPTEAPSLTPTSSPSIEPTSSPSSVPTDRPSSAEPSAEPTVSATIAETLAPTGSTTSSSPSASPSTTLSPSTEVTMTESPTESPSSPSTMPSRSPSSAPSAVQETAEPSAAPTAVPVTSEPSAVPTAVPVTSEPSAVPTAVPVTPEPTRLPAVNQADTLAPTPSPSRLPPVPSYVALDTVRNFLLEYSPMSTEDLFDQESSQFSALRWLQQWMASIPAQALGRFTKKRLVQRWALAVVYFSMNGPNWANPADWLSELDACDWVANNNQGFCDGLELVSLDLSSNRLRGTLPKEVSLLTTLTRLEMDRNGIIGTLPEQLGRLTNLVSLDFTRCDFTGTIPTELGNLRDLAILGLGRNDLVGKIPTEVGNLRNLIYLGLERNDVTGSIPSELTSLVELEYLALDWNALTGDVPSELANLVNLRTLILARNRLQGDVPEDFCERQMDFLAADCDEVLCPCCNLCCENGRGCASTRI